MSKITEVAAGILIRPDGDFLLGSRPEGKPYAGWWEFPGGKLEAGETPYEALVRELREEMGIEVEAATPWLVQRFVYPHATVKLHFFLVSQWRGEPHPHEGQAFVWQTAGATTAEPILPANTPILRGLELPPTLALSNVAELGRQGWLDALEQALAGGLRWFVLREPQLARAEYLDLAAAARTLARRYGARLLVHGDPALVEEVGADGVHLPSRLLAEVKERPQGWCGASVHDAAQLAQAAELGLDYVMLGPVLPTLSHPDAPTLGWDGFARLVEQGWPLAVYALGGMRPEFVATARGHGGHGVAMLRAAWR
ncbi:Nudix family hydrolase [Chitinimonas lacunae]|uniref:8-oxo-dGTP diphosphatase n=1 Tax=Chitinimonas lacunae TaxID=1963018 RepID=A0ABV8MS17_9NEIS